ncbi:MAG: hypothetical protein WED09_00495 [Homoserinimonas sp.]
MATMPLLVMTLHESRVWLRAHVPSLPLPEADAELAKHMRNSTKWFDATKREVDETLGAFDRLVTSHRGRFLGQARFRWARRFERDLGVYTHTGTPYLTTHGIAYAIESDPSATIAELGRRMHGLGESLGRMAVNVLGTADLPDTTSFLSTLSMQKLRSRDVLSADYYSRAVGTKPSISGYLHAIWAQLAFSEMLAATPMAEDRPTALKYRIIIFGHALTALTRLDQEKVPLARRLLEYYPDFATGSEFRKLRNALVHFTPHSNTSATVLDADRPMFGLLEHHLGVNFDGGWSLIDASTRTLHLAMSDELGHPKSNPSG